MPGGRGDSAYSAVPNKDDVALSHMHVGVCGEEQVAIPGCLHHLVQPRLIDRQLLHVRTCVLYVLNCVACLHVSTEPEKGIVSMSSQIPGNRLGEQCTPELIRSMMLRL